MRTLFIGLLLFVASSFGFCSPAHTSLRKKGSQRRLEAGRPLLMAAAEETDFTGECSSAREFLLPIHEKHESMASRPKSMASDLTAAAPMTVSSALDAMPIGRFHLVHLFRAAFAWCTFAACQELTPYVLVGMQQELGVSTFQGGLFAAAFTGGCTAGAVLSSIIGDRFGRRTLLVGSTSIAAVLGCCLAAAPSFAMICLLRAATGTAMTIAMSMYLVWYMEFLPTAGRGALTNAFGIGWPIGRALVISLAGSLGSSGWRRLLLWSGGLFAGLAVLLGLTAHESPRYLVVKGEGGKATRVLASVARINRSPFDTKSEIQTPTEKAPRGSDGSGRRRSSLSTLFSEHRSLIAFAISLMCALSCTTVLLDTWGPSTFGQLLHASNELPLRTMALFNMGDLAGIIFSIFVVDSIGRKGCFRIGFLVQAALLAALATLSSLPLGVRTAIGVLAASTRCFAWEAAHLWIVEAFPTKVRATALATALAVMRLASTLTLSVSGTLMDGASPAGVILSISTMLLICGVATMFAMPKETAGVVMEDDA
jgi:MFS family permease